MNKTNGVTPRRWLKLCNPGLAKLLSEKLGDDWVVNFDKVKDLSKFADDEQVLQSLLAVSALYLSHYFPLNEPLICTFSF